MSNVVIEFEQDNQFAYCVYVAHCNGSYLSVQHIQGGDLTDYRLNARHLAALVDYAKANQVQPQAATHCPCPPETSNDLTVHANANASTLQVDGGILVRPVPINKPMPMEWAFDFDGGVQ